jgi:hypothetical protein
MVSNDLQLPGYPPSTSLQLLYEGRQQSSFQTIKGGWDSLLKHIGNSFTDAIVNMVRTIISEFILY